jgi:hypothetical protein
MSQLSAIMTDVDRIIKSDAIQRVFPNLRGLDDTAGFEHFVAHPPDTISSLPKIVRGVVRGYGIQIDRHERFSEIWASQYPNQLFKIGQFVTDLDRKCGTLARNAALKPRTETEAERNAREVEQLGCTEFEVLYYLLACKTRGLYRDLQERMASQSITLRTVLNPNGPSSYDEGPCTVRDFRNLLRAIWYHLLHPEITGAIESAINARKYRFLTENPLLPTNFAELSQVEQDAFIQRSKKGINLAGPPLPQMFDRLDDIRNLPISTILEKIYRRRLNSSTVLLQRETSPSRPKLRMDSLAPFNGQGAGRHARVTFIDDDEESYIQEEIGRAELASAQSFEGDVKRRSYDGTMRFHAINGTVRRYTRQVSFAHGVSNSPENDRLETGSQQASDRAYMKDRSEVKSLADGHQQSILVSKYAQHSATHHLQVSGPHAMNQQSCDAQKESQSHTGLKDEDWDAKLRRWQSQYGPQQPEPTLSLEHRNSEPIQKSSGCQSTQKAVHSLGQQDSFPAPQLQRSSQPNRQKAYSYSIQQRSQNQQEIPFIADSHQQTSVPTNQGEHSLHHDQYQDDYVLPPTTYSPPRLNVPSSKAVGFSLRLQEWKYPDSHTSYELIVPGQSEPSTVQEVESPAAKVAIAPNYGGHHAMTSPSIYSVRSSPKPPLAGLETQAQAQAQAQEKEPFDQESGYTPERGGYDAWPSPSIYSAHPSAKPSPLRPSDKFRLPSPATNSSDTSSLGPVASAEMNRFLCSQVPIRAQSSFREQSPNREELPRKEQLPDPEQPPDRKQHVGPTTAVKVQKWLPDARTDPPGPSSPPHTPCIQRTAALLQATSSTAFKYRNFVPNNKPSYHSPSSHRLPFFREGGYSGLLPPKTPPKSVLQLQAAKSARENMNRLEAENAELKRQYSQLQDAVHQQSCTFVRENSKLQEQMERLAKQVSPTRTPNSGGGKGIIRKLGKLGSKSARSPRKSPSKF